MATYKDWYAENSAKIAKNRKNRYRNDPEYRQAALIRAREYRARMKDGGMVNLKPKVHVIGGEKMELFTSGQASVLLGVSAKTLRFWETAGKIPETYKVGHFRYYTHDQLNLISEWHDAGKEDKDFLSQLMFDNWV